MHLTLSTSFRQLRTYWLMSCAALFGFWLINPSSAQAQCSACIGDRVVRVLAFNITDCDDGACGDPDPDISLNGNLFSADGVCGIWDQPTDPIIVTSTSNSVTIAVVANEDDSGGLCAPDDAVVSTTWTIDLSTPAFGQTQTFNDNIGGNDYDFTIFYDVICEGTTSPILLDLQTDYPNYCGEPLFISASINEPLANAWSANNGLVELVFDPASNSFPQNPYAGGVVLLGAFDVLNSGGGSDGFSLDSDDFDAPDDSAFRLLFPDRKHAVDFAGIQQYPPGEVVHYHCERHHAQRLGLFVDLAGNLGFVGNGRIFHRGEYYPV